MSLTSKEKEILNRISIASHNNPHQPEFPFDDPKFPATPTYQIDVPGFSNIWLKDESHNPTGTHKDRMAWEIIVTYKDFLVAKEKGLTQGVLPQMSLISSGSAAFAIQSALAEFKLPALKVLADYQLDQAIITALEHIGAEIFVTDLSRKQLSPDEILQLTNNKDGIDITSADALDPSTRFYDWLSYEIINESPQWCFIPFGTGTLYENILDVAKKELSSHMDPDPRFSGDIEILRTCNYLGATTNNPTSQATRLYSPHLPFSHFSQQWLEIFKTSGYCGQTSNVLLIREEYLNKAIHTLINQGVDIEPSGAAGLALLLQIEKQVPHDDKILIVSTGKTKFDDI